MPTTDERLTALETAVVDLQSAVIVRPTVDQVSAIEAARDATTDGQADTNTDTATRLGKLERSVSILNGLFGSAYKKNGDDELVEDIAFVVAKGPVLKSPDTTQFRIIVDNTGVLDTVAI
jgi:hypothetical protein